MDKGNYTNQPTNSIIPTTEHILDFIHSAVEEARNCERNKIRSLRIFANKYRGKKFQMGINAVYEAIINMDKPEPSPKNETNK